MPWTRLDFAVEAMVRVTESLGTMDVAKATVWLYQLAFRRAFQLIRKNWGVIFAPLAYSLILAVASVLLTPFGFIGGMLLLLVGDACISSGFHIIENLLKTEKVDVGDFTRGFGVYLWEIVQVSFILWVPLTLVSRVLYSTPNGALILLLIQLLLYIVFNVVPELIYQAHLTGLELLSASYNFVIENWIEWFIPNLIIAFAGYFAFGPLFSIASSLPSAIQLFVVIAVLGLFVSYFMVFRGELFSLLWGSSRRNRVYRYKMGQPYRGNPW